MLIRPGSFFCKPDEPVAPPAPAPVVAEVPPPAEPPSGGSPWDADLAALVPDEALRGQVSGYLGEKWQPRMTQLEQELAAAKPGSAMYDDFLKDPIGTYRAIGAQMFGDEFGVQLDTMLEGDETPPPVTPAEQLAAPPMDPRVQAVVEAHETQQHQAQYRQNLDRLKGPDPENPQLNEELFHPFVVAAEGDFDQAFASYKEWEKQVAAAYGPPAVVDPAAPPAPVTLAEGGTAPPVAKKYTSIDEALYDTLDEMRATRTPAPATVGSV